MSAIVGMIDWRGGAAGPVVRKAIAALALHGRDGENVWDGGAVALGWRQTILHQEDYADQQPLTGGGGRFKLVFDGRLDNRADLARSLALASERARGLPDSAYVLGAFEKWGADCPQYLLGDFAFAVWDSEKRTLFLARDHFGRRPLVYHCTDNFFIFATMPSALFTHASVPRRLDEDSVIRHLCLQRHIPDKTFYRDICRVPVAHSLAVTRLGIRPQEYWRLDQTRALRFPNDDDYVEAFREVFDEAVACRLRTLHPIGSHLSSGWDSSSVTATAAGLLAGRNKRLTAFTHVPPKGWKPAVEIAGQIADEGPLAAAVAARFANIDHVFIHNSGRWDFRGLDDFATDFEQPRRDIHNAGWSYALHRQARERGVRVMLAGLSGNLTASYSGHDRLATLFRQGQFAAVAQEWAALRGEGRSVRNLMNLTFAGFVPPDIRHFIERAMGRPDALTFFNFVNPNFAAKHKLDRRRAISGFRMTREDRQTIMARYSQRDQAFIFGGALAAWDVDLRDPTGDKRVMEFCYAIPDAQFLQRGVTRRLLRRAMKGALPEALLQEKSRGRQAADWHETAVKSRQLLLDEIDSCRTNPSASAFLDLPKMREALTLWDEAIAAKTTTRQFEDGVLLRSIALGRFIRHVEGEP